MHHPEQSSPAVCIIIVSYNFEPWIRHCLTSALASSLRTTVLVVDNGSTDATREIIRKEYDDVLLIETGENLGFGRANNIGIRYAMEHGFDYLFLLNQDAWLESGALEKMVAAAERAGEYGILSPVHLNGRGDATDHGFREYTGLRNREEAERLAMEVTPYPFINAAMWLLPIGVVSEVGLFAPLFAHYGEDRNYVLRLRQRGYKVGVVRDATGYHDREARSVSRDQFLYAEFVYFLTEAANPCYGWAEAVAYSLLAAFKKACKALFRGSLSDSGAYLRIALRLMAKSVAVYRTRKEQRLRQR